MHTQKSENAGPASEIRKHYFLDRYVIIAAGRGGRPNAPSGRGEDHRTEAPNSPHIENDPAILEIPDPAGGWAVKVIHNKYPALDPSFPRGYGVHELVIDTPKHSTEFSQLSIDHIERILEAYRRRLTTLSRLHGIRYVTIFKNDGHSAGGSLNHSHTQIMALPMIPPVIEQEAHATSLYRDKHHSCPLCDALKWEERQKVRMIYEDKLIVAFAPYASSAGYEAWVMPRHHKRRLADLKIDEQKSLATALKLITSRIDSIQLSYNFFLQESLPEAEDHFHIKIQPRWSEWGGLELGTGIIINTIPPEQAALWYRGNRS